MNYGGGAEPGGWTMPPNDVSVWVASFFQNATPWEVAAALIGIGAVGYAFWGLVDNIFDLRYVRREGEVGGPRWITASFLLASHILFLLGWLGYTHVALAAAYLPNRVDISTSMTAEIAAMRLGYGVFGLLAQVTLRLMRIRLRHLPREQWAPMFGEAEKWRARFHEAQANVRRLEAEVATQRADKHESNTREARVTLRAQILERLLRQNGISIPPVVSVIRGTEEEEA